MTTETFRHKLREEEKETEYTITGTPEQVIAARACIIDRRPPEIVKRQSVGAVVESRVVEDAP